MKKFALIFVAVVGLWFVSANEVSAQTFYSRSSIRPTGLFNFQIGFGYPTPYYGGHYYLGGYRSYYSPGYLQLRREASTSFYRSQSPFWNYPSLPYVGGAIIIRSGHLGR